MITFVRRVRMLNGHFVEATDLLQKRVEYLRNTHGLEVELHVRFGGLVGEVSMISRHENSTDLELVRKRLSDDMQSAKLLKELAKVTLPGETYDEIWMSL